MHNLLSPLKMAFAYPRLVIEIDGKEAVVQIDEKKARVDISLLDDLNAGDYILLHDKLAIQVLDKENALQTIAALDSLNGVQKAR